MREPEQMGWYAELGSDGEPRSVHGIKRLMPEDAVEITEAQAKEISAAVRARQPATAPAVAVPQAAAAPVAEPVDLEPLQAEIAALKQQILTHADTIDSHTAAIGDQAAKQEAQAKRVEAVAGVVNHISEGLESMVKDKPA